jgi:hypothetical protein
MKPSSAGPNGRRQFELSLKMPAYEALDRLSSRIRPERPLAAVTGDWSSGYVGVFNGREFTFRRARNVPHVYALRAHGSVRDYEGGSVVTVRFRRGNRANQRVWLLRFLIAMLVIAGLVAVSGQPDLFAVVFLGSVICGATLWMARERESDRRELREFLLETFPNNVATGSPDRARRL